MLKVETLLATALVDVEDAYDHLRQPPIEDRDAVVRAINRATLKLEALCGNRPLKSRVMTLRVGGSGSRALDLPFIPVNSVTELSWWDQNDFQTQFALSGLTVMPDGQLVLGTDYFPSFPGWTPIEVTGEFGFKPGVHDDQLYDLKQYALDLVTVFYHRDRMQRGEADSISMSGVSATFKDQDVPDGMVEALDRAGYVRWI